MTPARLEFRTMVGPPPCAIRAAPRESVDNKLRPCRGFRLAYSARPGPILEGGRFVSTMLAALRGLVLCRAYGEIQPPCDLRFGQGSDDPIDFLPSMENQKRGNALNAKAVGGRGVLVHIHFGYPDLSRQLGSQLIHD